VLSRRLLTRMLGIDPKLVRVLDTVEEEVGGQFRLVVVLRPKAAQQSRCGRCQARCPGYDLGRVRRWRAVDFGRTVVEISAAVPRVRCRQHGVVMAGVPWARHGARHTRGFEATAAWCAVEMSGSATARLLRCSWRSVGAMVIRVATDLAAAAGSDGLDGLTRIGIDEISYRRGHKYLSVVVDHDTGRLVWIAPGRDKATLGRFFTLLGPQRCAQLALVSADGAEWIFSAVTEHCPNAKVCLDPFHVVAWAGKALDAVRAGVYTAARRAGQTALAQGIKGARYALWKDPAALTARQQATLAQIEATNQPLYRAYLLHQQLRQVFAAGGPQRVELLDAWLDWAAASGLQPFVELAYRIRRNFRDDIANTLTHRLSNGRVESVNTKIRLLTRIAFGFKSPEALIALVLLHLGGYPIHLPTPT
jgi:transposase